MNVTVTVSPGSSPIALGSDPSSQTALVSVHPVGMFISLTEYVPGRSGPLLCVSPSASKKFVVQLGLNSNCVESDGSAIFSTMIVPLGR